MFNFSFGFWHERYARASGGVARTSCKLKIKKIVHHTFNCSRQR